MDFSGPWSFDSRATVTGDFNGDGRIDYARLGATFVHLFISQGSGEFFQPVYPLPGGINFG